MLISESCYEHKKKAFWLRVLDVTPTSDTNHEAPPNKLNFFVAAPVQVWRYGMQMQWEGDVVAVCLFVCVWLLVGVAG